MAGTYTLLPNQGFCVALPPLLSWLDMTLHRLPRATAFSCGTCRAWSPLALYSRRRQVAPLFTLGGSVQAPVLLFRAG